jgi:hypothetical protein
MENEEQIINELVEELGKLSPSQSQINRDDLFYRAGKASGIKQFQSRKQLRIWQSYSAVMTLCAFIGFGWIMQNPVKVENQNPSRIIVKKSSEKNTPESSSDKPETFIISSVENSKVHSENSIVLNENSIESDHRTYYSRFNNKQGTFLALREKYLGDGRSRRFSELQQLQKSKDSESNPEEEKKPKTYREIMKELMDSTI